MIQNNHALWKSTMTSGAFLGLALIIFSIILVFLDITKLSFFFIIFLVLIPLLILIIGIVLGTKNYRDSVMDGHITYNNAIIVGTLIVLFASVISAFYSYIYNKIIDPSYVEKSAKAIIDKMVQLMQEWGYTDDQIEQQVEQMKVKDQPGALESALSSIPMSTFLGFFISLITSAFIKKDKSIQRDQISNIQY